ncbi:MAG: hypothetical protein IKP65_09085 [Alphaproteobacteria bacterium]|nr:hypothetical protein [Alphaproteobacteria bacterium]
MSIEVNREKGELVIKETMNFDYHVKPIFDEIQEDFRDFNEAEENNEFSNYELTASDKADILELIAYNYDKESEMYEVSLFDEDLITNSVKEWITDNFDIENFN